MKIVVEPRYDGMTVRDFVKTELGLSRGILTRLKTVDCGITLNDSHVTVRATLHEGDVLVLATDDREDEVNQAIEPVEMNLDIVYEDGDLIVINKPPDMPTHPSRNHHGDTLANGLSYYFAKSGTPFVFRAINRLDSDTSGVVMVAKNRPAAYKMSRELIAGRIEKRYIAVAEGIITPSDGSIIANIRRKSDSIILRETCDESDGDYARTNYRTLYSAGGCTVVGVTPITGRTHQIRVHFAHIGHPLAGDYLYGTEGGHSMRRHALHARSLTFARPSDGGIIRVEAELPEDIADLLKRLKQDNT